MTVPPQQPPPHGWQQPGQHNQPGQPQPGQYGQPGQFGHPGQYGPPAGGWQQQPVPPPPVTKRIPEDLPFTARPSVRKRGLLFGGLGLFIVLIVACPLGLAAADSGEAGAIAGIVGCLAVFIGLLLGLQMWLVTSGGPVLAVGPAGMWIKTRPTRGQAIWLPWEGIERVSRRRWSLEKMLVVKARDPRAGSNLGAFTAVDSSVLKLFYGSGFTATLNFADKSEQEIMAAVAHFSAGRVPIA